ncbi:MAG: UrcA family protein [Parasphingorhabdus sp.]|uniref:UrcA family protein n=1 Tax=Parasphingorhabdus sp. TaxID=2709688 RepID=UPI0030013433
MMATLYSKITPVLTAAVIAIAVPAHAEDKSVNVMTNDLNLSSAAGQETLNMRLARAVKSACDNTYESTLREKMDRARCMKEASLVAKQRAATVIATYKQRTLAQRETVRVATK